MPETLWCNSFSNTSVAWTETGVSPYLQDTDADGIATNVANAIEGHFSFEHTTYTTITSVKLYVEDRIAHALGDDMANLYMYDGLGGSDLLKTLDPLGRTVYGYENVDYSALLDTQEKINGCYVDFKYIKIGLTAHAIYCRRAYLLVTGSGAAPKTFGLSPFNPMSLLSLAAWGKRLQVKKRKRYMSVT